MTTAGLLMGVLQLPAAPSAAADPSPTPTPAATSSQPIPPSDAPRPYQPVERPESELHKKLAAQKPDFGEEDPLSQAWKRGEIDVDEYVRYSVERITHPGNVPEKFTSKDGLPHEAGLALYYALSLAEQQASPETKAWLAGALKRPAPETPPATTSAPPAAAPSPWTECGDHLTNVKFAGSHFDCVHSVTTTTRFDVYYNIDGVSQHFVPGGAGGGLYFPTDGVLAVDTSPANGVPDAIDLMTTNHAQAWSQYKTWGYGITGRGVQVYVGFDFGGVNPNHPGITFPTGGPGDPVGGPIILLPPDPGDPDSDSTARRDWRYTYLPYHEMFHAVQYHHLPNAHLGANLTSINWWMEATAEWATHELYKTINPSGLGAEAYASQLGLFLTNPTKALNAALTPWSTAPKRQYGAFIFANYLTERTTFNFVLQTWQAMDDKLPLEAIDQVLAGYGRDLKTELQGFAVANYRLTAKTPDLSRFIGAADGYADPHATTTWRNRLTDARPARSAEKSMNWGSSTNGLVPAIQPGGVSYLEFTPPGTGNGRLTISATGSNKHSAPDLRYLLAVWSGLSVRQPLRWVQADVNETTGTASIAINGGEVATLIVSRVDTNIDSNAADSESSTGESVNWSASLATEAGPRANPQFTNMFKSYGDAAGCAEWSGGDATQSVRLPSGKRAWFFSDTILGNPSKRPGGFETSFIRNSIVVQSGSSLRTITGGNTCKETDTSIDFWSRYAHTPVGQGTQYWTGDAKVDDGRVVKFYYKGIADEHTRGAVATFSLDELENNTVIKKTPTALADCFVTAPYPIIWGTALVAQGGYTYIYGFESKATFGKRIFVARTPVTADLTDQSSWRYFTGTDSGGNPQWGGSCSASRPLVPEAEGGFSVARINDQFWLIHHVDPHATPGTIAANPSRTPWGFTNTRVSLYSPPEAHTNPNYYAIYEARIHPGLSSDPNRVVISYNVNTSAVNIGCRIRTDYYPDTYRPRFIDVPTTAFFSPTAPRAVPLASAAPPQAAPVRSAPAEGVAVGRGIHPPAFTDTGRPPNAPPPPPDGTLPPAEETRAAAKTSVLAPDNSWYDNEVEPQRSNGGCPRLQDRKASALTATVQPQGHVNLQWDDVGQGVWYWIWHRDATVGESWKKYEIWSNKPEARVDPISGPWNHGHTFEWYVVPFSSTKGSIEGDKSNIERKAVQVTKPAAPTGVTATGSGANTVKVSWNGVTYPSSGVYYYIHYWTGSQAPVKIGPWGENSRDALVSPLAGGQNHCFQMTAENMGGESAKSATTCTMVP
ncbi:hypothetical protein [Streptosporangium roseum]|uniref:hypothetical protein n=1 Tax=Streptosporangium roseum TaxID=2001 RepID=UPI00331CDF06